MTQVKILIDQKSLRLSNYYLWKSRAGRIALTCALNIFKKSCYTVLRLLHSMMPRISVEKRSSVIEFTNGGMTQKEIAQTLHISRRSVQYVMKKFKETGRVADQERSG